MHSTQLSLFAPVKKKPSTVPVFLIYAGIIHAIGLALLLPMIVTLPGPSGDLTPETAIVDVEIIPVPSTAAKVIGEDEQTAALPQQGQPANGDTVEESGAETMATVVPEAEPIDEEKSLLSQDEQEEETAPAATPVLAPEREEPKADTAASAKSVPNAGKKPLRTAKPVTRRTVKTQTKFAPFNGAFSGLFAPAPAGGRKR